MASREDLIKQKKVFYIFGGGLSTQEEPQKIPINASPDLLNVRPIGQGAYGPRNGISRVGNEITGTGGRSGIFNFTKGLTEILISPRGTTIEYLRESDNTWQPLPGIGAYTDGARFGFANDNKYLYFCNAVEDFTIWDGKDLSGAITVNVDNTITSTDHGLVAGDLVKFTNVGGALPSGITAGVVYYVISTGLTADAFKVSTTFGGSTIDITDAGSGTNTFSSSVKTFSANPKGNIMQLFNNRLWMAGMTASPTTVQYSVINVGGTTPSFDFASAGSGAYAFNRDGGYLTALRIFTLSDGTKALKVFKKSQGTYDVYFDSSGNLAVLDGEQDTGAVNQKSTMNVENDIMYIDNGNNIANIGLRADIQGQIRTDSTTTGLDRTTTALNFNDACSIYWKKRKMAMYTGKSYGADNNDVTLVYFYDFKSWWRWSGIYAVEYTIYKDEVVWASSVDQNVYKYDETKFDDLDGPINSYFMTKDVEFEDEIGNGYSDLYKTARYAVFKGYISPGVIDENDVRIGGVMDVGIIYDGNKEQKVSATFSGSDENITTGEITISFGSVVFGNQAFGGTSLSETSFPMREFFVVVSLDLYSFLRARLFIELQGVGAPYLVTFMGLYAEIHDIDKWPSEIKI